MTLPVLFIPLLLQCWRQWKDDPKQTRFPWKKLLVPIGLFFLGVLLVGLPWWIRNVVSLGQFVLLATQTTPCTRAWPVTQKPWAWRTPAAFLETCCCCSNCCSPVPWRRSTG